jgi:hypothetical protein
MKRQSRKQAEAKEKVLEGTRIEKVGKQLKQADDKEKSKIKYGC